MNLTIAVFALLLSVVALQINAFFFHYTGNNYFPDGSLLIGISLFLMMVGCRLLFTLHHFTYQILRELLNFYGVMVVIAFMTNAVQYTPFHPIDKQIITFESLIGIDMAQIVSWTAQHPFFKQLLILIYNSLEYQLCFLPILIILCMKFSRLQEYYFLMLFSAIIGFIFYYFFPTTAPASVIHSPFFLDTQRATGIKFAEIHQHLRPSTIEGGLIALPSFHALWAWFCLYLSRVIKPLFFILLHFNVLLVASCVLLGWHYPIDLMGSLFIALLSHGMYYYLNTPVKS